MILPISALSHALHPSNNPHYNTSFLPFLLGHPIPPPHAPHPSNTPRLSL